MSAKASWEVEQILWCVPTLYLILSYSVSKWSLLPPSPQFKLNELVQEADAHDLSVQNVRNVKINGRRVWSVRVRKKV